MAAHGIGFIGNVKGNHHVAPGAVAIGAYPFHDGRDAVRDRGGCRIGADFIILDEINPGLAQLFDQIGNVMGTHADIGFNDRAKERPVMNLHPFTRALGSGNRIII